jgi:hypothetical protein
MQWAAKTALGILETTWKQILVPSNIAPDIDSLDGYRTGGDLRDITPPRASDLAFEFRHKGFQQFDP